MSAIYISNGIAHTVYGAGIERPERSCYCADSLRSRRGPYIALSAAVLCKCVQRGKFPREYGVAATQQAVSALTFMLVSPPVIIVLFLRTIATWRAKVRQVARAKKEYLCFQRALADTHFQRVIAILRASLSKPTGQTVSLNILLREIWRALKIYRFLRKLKKYASDVTRFLREFCLLTLAYAAKLGIYISTFFVATPSVCIFGRYN